MGLVNKTILNKSIIASENFDTYIGGTNPFAVQITSTLVGEALDFAPSDVTIATDRITELLHPYINGTEGRFTTTGALPTGLAAVTDYYIFNKTDNDYQVSLSADGGSVQEITGITTTTEGSVKEITDVTCLADILAVAEVTTITAIGEGSVAEVSDVSCIAEASVKEVTEIVADSRTNTGDGEYFDIDASDGTTYRVAMDTTGGSLNTPVTGGRDIFIEVDISGVADTAAGVGDAVASDLNDEGNFVCPASGTGTILCTDANFGAATDAVNGDLGNAWAISNSVQGVDSALNGKYFILQDEDGTVGFWIDVDNSGTSAPTTGAARDVELITVASEDTNIELASAIYLEVINDSKFVAGVDGGDGTFVVASSTYGPKADGSDGDSGFTVTEDTAGADSSLHETYFLAQDTAGSVAFWISVDDDGEAVEPAGSQSADRSVKIITIASEDADTDVGGLLRTAMDDDSKFTTAGAGADCIATNVDEEDLTDMADGDSGMAFVTDTQGVTAASLDAKYFVLQDEVGTVGFWIDLDNDGTTTPGSGAAREVELITVTAGMTNIQVASAIYLEVINDSKFEAGADGADGTFTVASSTFGPKDDGSNGDSGFTVVEDTPGANTTVDGKYFILEDTDGTVAFWMDVGDTGTAEPAHGADRSVEVTTIVQGDAIGDVGTSVYDTIVNDGKFEAGSDDTGGNLLIKNTDVVNITQQDAGDSGFTVVEDTSYADVADLQDQGTGVHTFTPTAISGSSAAVQKSCDGSNWIDVAGATNITGDATFMVEDADVGYTYVRVKFVISAGFLNLKAQITGWTKA